MASRGDVRGWSSEDRLAMAGEILGAVVHIPAGPGLPSAVDGTVVDESLALVHVRRAGTLRSVAVPKSRLAGTIVLGGRELPLSGEALRVRPEDRTKRLLAGGPRRFR